jgi:hypothetical protein
MVAVASGGVGREVSSTLPSKTMRAALASRKKAP